MNTCKHERVETIDFDTVILCLDCGHEEAIKGYEILDTASGEYAVYHCGVQLAICSSRDEADRTIERYKQHDALNEEAMR